MMINRLLLTGNTAPATEAATVATKLPFDYLPTHTEAQKPGRECKHGKAPKSYMQEKKNSAESYHSKKDLSYY